MSNLCRNMLERLNKLTYDKNKRGLLYTRNKKSNREKKEQKKPVD